MLKFIEYVYDIFGMTFEVMLSTRPPTVSHGRRGVTCRYPLTGCRQYIGDASLWDEAEAALAEALKEFCGDTCVTPGRTLVC